MTKPSRIPPVISEPPPRRPPPPCRGRSSGRGRAVGMQGLVDANRGVARQTQRMVSLLSSSPSFGRSADRPAAWLALAVSGVRQHGGNDGYEDDPAVEYRWDNRVPHHASIRVGDAIVMWDKVSLLGASIIEKIAIGSGSKAIHKCPKCERSGISSRATKLPNYKCDECGFEFDEPRSENVPVKTFRGLYEPAWVDLGGALTLDELRELCVKPKEQNSFRPLRWDDFKAAIERSPLGGSLSLLDFTARRIQGGHRSATVRVRIGQEEFRRRLLQAFGPVCAISGPAPAAALDAGHLYSYAATGEHHEHGGLLFRRDVHRLFDLGELAVNPATSLVDVRAELRNYQEYARLHDRALAVSVRPAHDKWFAQHWRQHRS